MSGRAADRDDGFQDAAGALGQGIDPVRDQRPAEGDEVECEIAGEDRGVVSPDGQYQLSADDYAFACCCCRQWSSASTRDGSRCCTSTCRCFWRPRFRFRAFTWFRKRSCSRRRWWRTFFYLPFLMALGIGLTITNSKGVIEALIGKTDGVCADSEVQRAEQGAEQEQGVQAAAGNTASAWALIPWIELAVGCYFAMTVWYAIANENYITVPFLILFVYGYWYTGLMSLLQGRFELFGALQQQRRRACEAVSGWGLTAAAGLAQLAEKWNPTTANVGQQPRIWKRRCASDTDAGSIHSARTPKHVLFDHECSFDLANASTSSTIRGHNRSKISWRESDCLALNKLYLKDS